MTATIVACIALTFGSAGLVLSLRRRYPLGGDSKAELPLVVGLTADWLERAKLTRLVIHTTDDRSIRGMVAEVSETGILLRAATLLGKDDVELAGEVWVPRAHVAFAQTAASDMTPA